MRHIISTALLFATLAVGLASCGGKANGNSLKSVIEETKTIAAESGNTSGAKESEAAVETPDGVEIPAPLSGTPEQILQREGYTVSYNATTMQPNWVAWQLTESRTEGTAKRGDYPFTADEEVDEPRVDTYDYRSSGYDRGHMCPAGDNKWSAKAMEQSFLMTNICPQAPSLNRGDWNEMEIACRKWAKREGTLYVVCGPIFYRSAHKRIGAHKVPVPEAFFKVVLSTSGTPKAIGFIYKNGDGNRPKGDYVNTVDDVERITGIDFFPALPDDVEKRVEASCNLDDWEF